MATLPSRRNIMLLGLLVGAVLIIVACASDPNAQLISPNMVVETGEGELIIPTPTPAPKITDLSEEEIYAGLPEDIAAAMATADPERGAQIAQNQGCVGCHGLEQGQQLVGPSWYGVADRAVTRVPGESPALYLYQSIADPGAYEVEGYPTGLMPPDYLTKLSSQDIADLVAYLLTFRGE